MSVKSRMPGLLKVQHPHTGPRGFELADASGLNQVCQDVTQGNAYRLAACWNACEGIPTQRLEDIHASQRWLVDSAEMDVLVQAVRKLHAARGRHHTQQALCDLFDLVGLSSERPKTQARKTSGADINVRKNHDKTRAAVPNATAVSA